MWQSRLGCKQVIFVLVIAGQIHFVAMFPTFWIVLVWVVIFCEIKRCDNTTDSPIQEFFGSLSVFVLNKHFKPFYGFLPAYVERREFVL